MKEMTTREQCLAGSGATSLGKSLWSWNSAGGQKDMASMGQLEGGLGADVVGE